MLIITADDLGRDVAATESCIACHRKGAITSSSFMVFMADSERAAKLAVDENLETGLHINLVLPFDDPRIPSDLKKNQGSVVDYFGRGNWTQAIYNPLLVKALASAFDAQLAEYRRLFGREPAHFNGHKHFHLSLNVAFSGLIPSGSAVRRNFTFYEGGKGGLDRFYRLMIDRCYRRVIDARLLKNHVSTDAFFSLSPVNDLPRLRNIIGLARTRSVELMAHPWSPGQEAFLAGQEFGQLITSVRLGGFGALGPRTGEPS
jgi:hypothetical protein